jgi:hypothetical protein
VGLPTIEKSMVSQCWEAWWLNGSAPDCCPAVLGSNPVSPQPTADCQYPDGLPPGMALGWGLTSVRGDRGENHEKWTAGLPKTYKEKKVCLHLYAVDYKNRCFTVKINKAKRSCGIADYWKTILNTLSKLVLKSDNFGNIVLEGYEMPGWNVQVHYIHSDILTQSERPL